MSKQRIQSKPQRLASVLVVGRPDSGHSFTLQEEFAELDETSWGLVTVVRLSSTSVTHQPRVTHCSQTHKISITVVYYQILNQNPRIYLAIS